MKTFDLVYLEENGIRLLLTPVDFSCRVAVKV